MSDGFEKLKEIGAQRIHEKTHIAKQHAQDMLHDSFERMTKIQFFGFVSIMEREFGLELDELRNKGSEYFDQFNLADEEETKVFLATKKKKKFTSIYIVITIITFVIVSLYTTANNSSVSKNIKVESIDNSTIKNAQKNIAPIDKIESESSLSLIENNETVKNIIEAEKVVKSLKIIPRTKLWMGYMDLNTHQKYQKLFSDEFSVDTDREWLLFLGHGNINVELNGEIKEYNVKKNIRFVYKSGELRRIDYEEFKILNRGSQW